MMKRYWYHAESDSIGVFTEDEYKAYDENGGMFGSEPVDLITRERYFELAASLGVDVREDHNNFELNLEYAQAVEEQIGKLLEAKLKGFTVLTYNDDKACDIVGKFNDKTVTFEVKEDVRVKDTGNVVIEKSSRGKPSGISTSTADFWIFRLHLPDGIEHIMLKRLDVRQMIKDRAFWNKRQMKHTDSCNVLYFFKVETLKKYSCMTL